MWGQTFNGRKYSVQRNSFLQTAGLLLTVKEKIKVYMYEYYDKIVKKTLHTFKKP